jgi:hypothetical protein
LVPAAWTITHVLALYKKLDPKLPKNYRLIFIEGHLSKLFQKLLVQHLDDHFEGFAPEFSNGFRRKRGCIDALFLLKGILRKRKEHGLETRLLFLDIKSAFDRVPRELLWWSLQVCGVDPKLIRVLQALYRDRKGELNIDGAAHTMRVSGGTCQGALVAPRLFSYYLYVILEIWVADNSSALSAIFYAEEARAGAESGAPIIKTKLENMKSMFNCLFNVADDTAAIFETRASLVQHGGSLISMLEDFGMDTHLPTAATVAAAEKPKTAAMYIKPQGSGGCAAPDFSDIPRTAGGFITFVENYEYVGVQIHNSLSD